MYYCSVSSNEQCCEARQMEGTSDLIMLDMGAFFAGVLVVALEFIRHRRYSRRS